MAGDKDTDGWYRAGPGHTRGDDGERSDRHASRPSRVEERRAARAGRHGTRPPGHSRSEQYPPSALEGRSTRNGAAARTRAGSRAAGNGHGARPRARTGYRRYFDYPRSGKRGWRAWVPSIKQVCGASLAGVFLILGLIAFEYETVQIPDPHSAAFAQQSTFTYDGGKTAFAYDGSTNRTIVDFAQIPATVQNAVISQEDKTFWTNPGVSYTGTLRSLLVDLTGGSTEGGSTITQQYVKNAYLTQAQTYSRKIDEIFISLKLAQRVDKQTILTDYLNTCYFGRDSNGIAAAAKAWFGLSLAQMNAEPTGEQASQAALLTAMLNSPTTYSGGWDPTLPPAAQAADKAAALARWRDTLTNMKAYGHLSAADYQYAVSHPPQPVPLGQAQGVSIVDAQMKQAAIDWLGTYESQNPNSGLPTVDQIAQGGYTVVTTFNKTYMADAAQAMQNALVGHENSVDKATLQAGLAAVDPATGDLVAFYGGPTYENTATQVTTQAGSTFKIFTLSTAFAQGISPDSHISGTEPWPDPSNPTEVAEGAGGAPIHNDSPAGKSITLQAATDASVNTAFIRLEESVNGGYNAVHATAEKFGLDTADMGSQWDSSAGGCDNVRFTLGICFTDPARMADAYAVLAADGTYHPLTEILKIINNSTGQVYTPTETTAQAIDPNTAAEVTGMFTGVIHDSDGTAHQAYDNSSLRMTNIAGKTGTGTMDITSTTDQAMHAAGFNPDACNGPCGTGGVWFDGYSSKLAVSVGISRWQTITVGGKQENVQIPVDDIDGTGAAYGAQFPFAAWAEFMNRMQSTPYGGDQPFATPVINPSDTVLGTPSATPSASAGTASPSTTPATPSTTAAATTGQTPSETPTAPTGSCTPGLLTFCTSPTPSTTGPSGQTTASTSTPTATGAG
ncbi:penicillin-binding protein [Actinospica sp. MGRD01-02]|uniref:Penicillin-binding protein n=1 Tax=Actinospica acidithermotolerans TaxID=2828514 RepID=A0A941ECP9_9ACTN|nr:transglycosylase domain-containing protein [Actinospica acidithermotolerans]MBR7828203.1 penicillin-binding protein [Actinospica acidithermotolerans]